MPFAGYKNFSECIAKNGSKKDPKAYCATIMRATEASDPSTEKRKEYAKKGVALPDGSYPIPDVAHLTAAIKAYGRASNKAAAKRHIIKRARALGRTDLLPEDWGSKSAKESELPTVTEILSAQEATFEKGEDGKMTAHVQLIKVGRALGKKRDYTAGALQKAAQEGIYNGLRMFVDHSEKPPTSRKTMEMVSAVEKTSWDPQKQAIVGDVEFFDEKFFNFAQRAKTHMGVSADHVIGVTYVQEGRDRIERVTSIPMARSVDWVVYPAAGGEVLSFAREAEGENDVEWTEVTLDQLKEHVPDVLEEFKKSLATTQESEGESEGGDDKKTEGTPETLTKDDIQRLVQEAMSERDQRDGKIRDTTKKVREFVSKAGLPSRTQARIVNAFADAETYDEKSVKEAVDEAKEELKEAGARGPQIKNMGPSGDTGDEKPEKSQGQIVRESVEGLFGVGKTEKKEAAAAGEKK